MLLLQGFVVRLHKQSVLVSFGNLLLNFCNLPQIGLYLWVHSYFWSKRSTDSTRVIWRKQVYGLETERPGGEAQGATVTALSASVPEDMRTPGLPPALALFPPFCVSALLLTAHLLFLIMCTQLSPALFP